MRLLRLIPLAAAIAFAACDDPADPNTRFLGYISVDGSAPDVEVTQVDSAISVVVTTYGLPGECTVRSGENVVVDDRTITVRPFDRLSDEPCLPEGAEIEHPFTLDVEEGGTWTVRVEGRARNGLEDEPADAEVEVDVDLEILIDNPNA